MARTKLTPAQVTTPATGILTAGSGAPTGTVTALTGSYTFIAGQKYLMCLTSSNPNSTGVWQMSYSVSGGGTQSGINHGRFGGASGLQSTMNMSNIFVPTASGSQTVTVTATLVTSGSAAWDDVAILIIPLLN